MTIFTKICGISTEEAVASCVAAGVDAIGFVFHPQSKRYVTPRQAAKLSQTIPSSIKKVAVARRLNTVQWQEILATLSPDVIQLDAAELGNLAIPMQVEVLPVYRESQPPLHWPHRCLWEGIDSGIGLAVDWQAAAHLTAHTELILAGGLTVDNVATAITIVRPFGVDVSSGVEDAAGRKCPDKIFRFAAAARAAAIPLNS
jgi:phosphoribosylanthranilate isomerase